MPTKRYHGPAAVFSIEGEPLVEGVVDVWLEEADRTGWGADVMHPGQLVVGQRVQVRTPGTDREAGMATVISTSSGDDFTTTELRGTATPPAGLVLE